jgi:1-acyl-sn-glycerol-3-phosphate acyltransferase
VTILKTIAKGLFSIWVWFASFAWMISGSILWVIPMLLIAPADWAHKWATRLVLGMCIPIARIKTQVTFHRDYQPERRGIFAQNHINVLDGAMAVYTIPHRFTGLMNHWHFRIPGYGWIMKICKSIKVYPRSAGRTEEITAQARDRVENHNLSILTFPEGHRTMTGKIGPFKRGVFFMARDAGVPIIPICVRGFYEVQNKHSWMFTPGPVDVYIGECIETEGLDDDGVRDLTERVRQIHIAWVEEGREISYADTVAPPVEEASSQELAAATVQ